jgi:hypothetical protein
MSAASTPIHVDFWFDPTCPWTWLTSRWILEVRKVRPLVIDWHVMSLAVLNENRLDELPEPIQTLMAQAWAPVRVLMAAQHKYGPDALEPLYNALGYRYHPLQEPKVRQTIESALREAHLPLDLADAGDADTYDEALRDSHHSGIALVGSDVGSPIIAVPSSDNEADKYAFFGPVLNPTPIGEEAVRLWDGVMAVASTPHFYEMKRTRTGGPDFGHASDVAA